MDRREVYKNRESAGRHSAPILTNNTNTNAMWPSYNGGT